MQEIKTQTLSPEKLARVAQILKSIAHPVKLQILQLLRDEEQLDVTSLCQKLGMDCEISMMSHHLSKLKDCGILQSKKRGKQVFYSLKNRTLLSLFHCMDNCDLI